MGTVEQTVSTRNQSTANYQTGKIFIFDNRYNQEVFADMSSIEIGHLPGALVKRASSGRVTYVTKADLTSSTQPKIIGILATEVVEGATAENVNVCVKGTIDPAFATVVDEVTVESVTTRTVEVVNLNTIMNSGFSVKDTLDQLGLHTEGAVEHTKFDN